MTFVARPSEISPPRPESSPPREEGWPHRPGEFGLSGEHDVAHERDALQPAELPADIAAGDDALGRGFTLGFQRRLRRAVSETREWCSCRGAAGPDGVTLLAPLVTCQ